MSSMEVFETMRLAPKTGYSWNMVLEYDHNTVASLSDEQLAGTAELAKHAKKEMSHNLEKRHDRDCHGIRKPAAVSVIAVERCLYVASSIKSSTILSIMNRQFCSGVEWKSQAPRTGPMPIVASSQQQSDTEH